MYKKTTFSNGIRVITVPLHETNAVTVLVLVGAGSRHEPKPLNGVSHFIEHMMFKGTKKRPATLDISKNLDSVGAEYNAFTGKDHTGYYIKTDYKQADLALDILSDMLTNSKFDQTELTREKKVIIEEINMYQDNPLMHIENLLEQSLFQGNSLGWDIAGSRQSVSSVSRKQMLGYKDRLYRGDNIVIVVAGRIKKSVLKDIKKYFGGIPDDRKEKAKNEEFDFPVFQLSQKKPAVILQYKETEQIQLALGFPGYSYFDKNIYPLALLAVILGGTMSSRLFIEVRERKGLCYFIRSGMNIYQDTGSLYIQSGLDKTRLEPAIKLILKELKKVKRQGVTAAELKRAKDNFRGKLMLSLEDSMKLAAWYGEDEILTSQTHTPHEKINKIMAVTRSDVKRVANEVLNHFQLNLALIGPFKSSKPFLKLLKL